MPVLAQDFQLSSNLFQSFSHDGVANREVTLAFLLLSLIIERDLGSLCQN